jgi:hypothetical protein
MAEQRIRLPDCLPLAQVQASLAEDTVERHRANLMAKLDVHDVAGLTRIALEHGLIFVDE